MTEQDQNKPSFRENASKILHSFKKGPRLSTNKVIAVLFLAIMAVEAGFLYFYLYKNLIFKNDTPLKNNVSISVRINTENYDRVISRLNSVADYNATSTIYFIGSDPNTGRGDPFSDPE